MNIDEYLKSGEEPFPDSSYGDGYRCSAYLKDGLFLPCVIIRKSKQFVDLACRRIKEEKSGTGIFGKSKNPQRDMIQQFVTRGNRINDYDIKSVEKSKFAIPLSLLKEIKGETIMGWTGFVFEMKDGKLFSYGSNFLFEFFDLPEGYSFEDVVKVHNHSFLSNEGSIVEIRGLKDLGERHELYKVYRERPYFECFIE